MKKIKNPGIYTTIKLGLLVDGMLNSGIKPNMLSIIKQSDTSHISVRAIVENLVVRDIVTLTPEGQNKVIQPSKNYTLFKDFCMLWNTIKEEETNDTINTEKPVDASEPARIDEGAGDNRTTEDIPENKTERGIEGDFSSTEIGQDDSLLPKW